MSKKNPCLFKAEFVNNRNRLNHLLKIAKTNFYNKKIIGNKDSMVDNKYYHNREKPEIKQIEIRKKYVSNDPQEIANCFISSL